MSKEKARSILDITEYNLSPDSLVCIGFLLDFGEVLPAISACLGRGARKRGGIQGL